ncbi:DNA translocase FtsK 4TM domain-containing protein [Candidatus Saccharibacteria bacterium]|nr:DNA translocase FtsK 4TM domain-containing protein [Candidatus Saccharibacteria bacterium]
MAKRKTRRVTAKKRSKKNSAPEHVLPVGFWQQASAVGLIALSILMIVAWFGVGGPVLEWLQNAFMASIGFGTYIVPVVAVYVAVEIFRSEDNRLPFVMKFASFLVIAWVSGLFGLIEKDDKTSYGGFVGDTINSGILSLVDKGVAIFLYSLLIIITVLFILRVSPMAIIEKIKDLLATAEREEQESNSNIMKKATKASKSTDIGELKLNAGVPMMQAEEEPKKLHLSSLKNSVVQDKQAEEKSALVAISDPNWKAPSLDLLEKKQKPADPGDVQHNAQAIKDTLHEFNIDVEMEGANIGPKVTQYTLKPPAGVKLTKISQLETNIALNLAAQSLRIEAPIPGKRAVGIEVPNRKAADVRLRGILEDKVWRNSGEPLSFAIGRDISGMSEIGKLNKMPHLLIAGQTGSGKSVMINTLLSSLLYRNSPSEMKLILVDPKQVEMKPYDDIPHLLTPIITEPEKTISALKWAVNEMERRYKLLAEERVREISSYNKKINQKGHKISVKDEDGNIQQHEEGTMPYIVIIIDELADLMMVAARDVEALIVRLAQKARAVGIHLVLATQRPSVNVITGLIKANVPARIAFTVASQIDSRTILDQIGAEKLLGQGDMLLKTADMSKPKRVQGAWVMDEEVIKITDYLREQSEPQYNEEIVSQPVQINSKGGMVMDMDSGGSDDSMYNDAVRVVIEGGKASTSYLQRRLRIGYSRAARLIEEMEENSVIGPADGNRPRTILISSVDELSNGEED